MSLCVPVNKILVYIKPSAFFNDRDRFTDFTHPCQSKERHTWSPSLIFGPYERLDLLGIWTFWAAATSSRSLDPSVRKALFFWHYKHMALLSLTGIGAIWDITGFTRLSWHYCRMCSLTNTSVNSLRVPCLGSEGYIPFHDWPHILRLFVE